jgi:hypothetical protein
VKERNIFGYCRAERLKTLDGVGDYAEIWDDDFNCPFRGASVFHLFAADFRFISPVEPKCKVVQDAKNAIGRRLPASVVEERLIG